MQLYTNITLATKPSVIFYVCSMFLKNKPLLTHYFLPTLLLLITAQTVGLFTEIIGTDGTLYASIAKQMVQTHNYNFLYINGEDWLDKPHIPFWLAALSFKLFGVNAFAYKLPNFIFFLVGCFYVYQISKQFLHKEIAQLSTLVFAGSLHVFICNTDVRAEIFLATFTIAAFYHAYCLIKKMWSWHIIACAAFTALAIMTKGIFTLIPIFSGMFLYFLCSKQVKQFIQVKWYVLLLLIIIFILPELYSLYTQFDLHPEKIVFGKTGVSGLKFFFWDSQVGRFFNTGPITGDGDKLFFLHTFLWAFLPWSLVFIYSLFKTKIIVNNNAALLKSLGFSMLISFLVFSLSKFQLPHYIVILFPFCSIWLGVFLQEQFTKTSFVISEISTWLLLVASIAITTYLNLNFSFLGWMIFALLWLVIVCTSFIKIHTLKYINWIVKNSLIISMLCVMVFGLAYTKIMNYQAGMVLGKHQQQQFANAKVFAYKTIDYNFSFYSNQHAKPITNISEVFITNKTALVYLPTKEIKNINADSFLVKPIISAPNFSVSMLEKEFIKVQTRGSVVDSFCLAELTIK